MATGAGTLAVNQSPPARARKGRGPVLLLTAWTLAQANPSAAHASPQTAPNSMATVQILVSVGPRYKLAHDGRGGSIRHDVHTGRVCLESNARVPSLPIMLVTSLRQANGESDKDGSAVEEATVITFCGVAHDNPPSGVPDAAERRKGRLVLVRSE